MPPSSELSGSPTRMLMFWLGLVPYSTLTWQYETFGPLAGTIRLVTDFTAGSPARPFAGSVASSVQCTGGGGSTCLSFAAHGADGSKARLNEAMASETYCRDARCMRLLLCKSPTAIPTWLTPIVRTPNNWRGEMLVRSLVRVNRDAARSSIQKICFLMRLFLLSKLTLHVIAKSGVGHLPGVASSVNA